MATKTKKTGILPLFLPIYRLRQSRQGLPKISFKILLKPTEEKQMNKQLLIAVLLCFGLVASPAYSAKIKKADHFSYAVGYQIGTQLRGNGVEPNTKILMQAIKDALADKKPAISMKDMSVAVKEAEKDIRKKRTDMAKVAMEKGNKFLAENKKKKGVVELKSGLQYKILKKGKGKKPTANDTLVAHYKGSLINGKVFDQNTKDDKPMTFTMDRMIQGWKEVLPLMPAGSKWEVYIPSKLAYGARGAMPNIGPNETLVFEIDLLEVKEGQAKANMPMQPHSNKNPHAKK
jgi:FKBP-type peptidyl-prolyl cis-trans isomerase FklB